MNKVLFGKRVNAVRKEQLYTSESLAEKAGINAVFLRQIESAARLPSLPMLVRICNALHVSPNYLLGDSLDPNESDQFEALCSKIRTLTPRQIDLVTAMIEVLIEKLEE